MTVVEIVTDVANVIALTAVVVGIFVRTGGGLVRGDLVHISVKQGQGGYRSD